MKSIMTVSMLMDHPLILCEDLKEIPLSNTDRLPPLLWLKSFWRRLFLPGKLLFIFIVNGQVFQWVWADLLVLNTFTVLRTLSLLVFVRGNSSITKTLMTKFVESLQIPWTNILPLVLLNLSSTSFEMHTLLPFEIVTGHPVHLAPTLLTNTDEKRDTPILQWPNWFY